MKKQTRCHQKIIRCTRDEKRLIDKKAREFDMSVTELMITATLVYQGVQK